MRTITPLLWFDTQAEEAMNLDLSILKNSKAISVNRAGPQLLFSSDAACRARACSG